MKVLLIYPPFSLEESYGKGLSKIGNALPPIGLAYLAAVLENHSFHVKILDGSITGLGFQDMVDEAVVYSPEVIGISVETPAIEKGSKLSYMLKGALPDVKIVLGGPHPSIFPEQSLKENPNADFLVIGEGEYTLLDLVTRLHKDSADFADVEGIAFPSDNGIVITPSRPRIQNLDELPFPARHLLPMDLYKPSPFSYKHQELIGILASRGCPFSCTFCSKPVFGRKYAVRSVKNVLDEIRFVMERYGAKEILFLDDEWGLNRKWVLEFCNSLIEEGLDIDWSCKMRVDRVDSELLKKMARAGCWYIFYGIESGCQDLLENVQKGTNIDQIKDAVRLTKEAGIEVRAGFMLGLPGETPEKALKTIEFAKELNCDLTKFNLTTPFPGTKLYDDIEKYGILQGDALDFNFHSPVFVPKGYSSGEELADICKQAFREFYFRPSYVIERLARIRSVEDVRRLLKGLIGLVHIVR